MAQAWGGWAGSYGRWCMYIDAYISNETDEYADVRTDVYWHSNAWGFDTSASGYVNVDGQTNSVATRALSPSGTTSTRHFVSTTKRIYKNASAQRIVCFGSVTLTGYQPGYSSAQTTVTVGSIAHYAPKAPKNFSLSRVSDSKQKMSWGADCTGLEGHYPWTGIYIDRQTDNGSWTTIATLSWSATSYTDSSTSAGHYYTYRARSYNEAGSTASSSASVYTSPTSFGGITATKPTTTTVALRPKSLPKWYDGVEFQTSANSGSSWSAATVKLTASGEWTDSSPLTGTVIYRGRAYKKQGSTTLYGAWATSNSVITTCAPNAPSVSGLQDTYETGSEGTVTWVPNHPDSTAQTSAEVEITTPDGVTDTVTVSGTTTSYTITFSEIGTYKVRIRTKGLHASYGTWSGYSAVIVADRPNVWFTQPTEDGSVVKYVPIEVEWEISDATGVAYQELTLSNIYGNVILDIVPDDLTTRSYTIDNSYGIANESEFTLTIFVRSGSTLTASATRTFTTEWLAPEAPEVSVTYDDELAGHLTIQSNTFIAGKYAVRNRILSGPLAVNADKNIEIGGSYEMGVMADDPNKPQISIHDLPSTESYTLIRENPDGTRKTLATEMGTLEEYIDRLPPLNTDFKYIAVSYSETGASATTEYDTICKSNSLAFNFGSGATDVVLGTYNPDWSRTPSHSVETYHFMDGATNQELPMAYAKDELDVADSFSFDVDKDTYKKLNGFAKTYYQGWVRDLYGEVMYGVLNFGLSRMAPDYWSATADVQRTRFEEPSDV